MHALLLTAAFTVLAIAVSMLLPAKDGVSQ